MPDKQLVAFSGQPDGSIELVDLRQPPGHTNTMLRQAGDYRPIYYNVGDILDLWGDFEDALKFSGCINLSVDASVVVGGREDVADFNRKCKNVRVRIKSAHVRARYVGTIKGESDGITFEIGALHGRAKEVEFDIGNWSDQAQGRTKDIHLWVEHADHQPVRARVLHGHPPTTGGGVKWKVQGRWKGVFHFFYNLLKKVGLG